jgi:hypothetical protein
MSTTTIEKSFYVGGELTDVTSAVFSKPVTRTDTGEEIIPSGTALDHTSTGIYSYTFADPEYNLVYSYKITMTYSGQDYIYEGNINGSVDTLQQTYVSIDYADNYFNYRLFSDPWHQATSTEKLSALLMATRVIDQLPLRRSKLSSNQTLAFPRTGQTSVPDVIKFCCCEEALSLLAGNDPVEEAEALGITGESYSGVRTNYDPNRVCIWKDYGFTSKKAFEYVYPYTDNLDTFRLDRI